MIQKHPITPPFELVEEWFLGAKANPPNQWVIEVATQAARWGADQELEACCSWADATGWHGAGDMLRDARRSKPPNLKELALEVLDDIDARLDAVHYNILRRAIEFIPD